jgi:hypothetical protein
MDLKSTNIILFTSENNKRGSVIHIIIIIDEYFLLRKEGRKEGHVLNFVDHRSTFIIFHLEELIIGIRTIPQNSEYSWILNPQKHL